MQLKRTRYDDFNIPITEKDKTEKTNEILSLMKEEESLEFKLKQQKEHYTGEIKDKKNRITEIRKVIEGGKELKRIAVEETRDLKEMLFTLRRLDNNEIIEQRVLRSDEIPSNPPPSKQPELNLEGGEAACEEPVYGPEDSSEIINVKLTDAYRRRDEVIVAIDQGQPNNLQAAQLAEEERTIIVLFLKLIAAVEREAKAKASPEGAAPGEGQGTPNTAGSNGKIEESKGAGEGKSLPLLTEPFYPAFFAHCIEYYRTAARLAADVDSRLVADKKDALELTARSYQRYAKGERTPEKETIDAILSVLPKEIYNTFREKKPSPSVPASPQGTGKSPAKKSKKGSK